jgi:hypothetical protein
MERIPRGSKATDCVGGTNGTARETTRSELRLRNAENRGDRTEAAKLPVKNQQAGCKLFTRQLFLGAGQSGIDVVRDSRAREMPISEKSPYEGPQLHGGRLETHLRRRLAELRGSARAILMQDFSGMLYMAISEKSPYVGRFL